MPTRPSCRGARIDVSVRAAVACARAPWLRPRAMSRPCTRREAPSLRARRCCARTARSRRCQAGAMSLVRRTPLRPDGPRIGAMSFARP